MSYATRMAARYWGCTFIFWPSGNRAGAAAARELMAFLEEEKK